MLIKDTDTFRKYVAIDGTTTFDTVEPYIEVVERTYIKKLLGAELYTQLSADDLDDKFKPLLKIVQLSIANLTMFKGFDMLNSRFSDGGFVRSSKEQALYRYQEENLKNSFKTNGFNAMDDALELLFSDLSTFDKFKTSTYYLDAVGAFFKTTSEFDKIINIGASRLIFIQISRYFDRAIDFQITPVLGLELMEKIKAEMIADNPTLKYTKLVPMIQKPLAFFAISEGLNELGVNITEKGVFFEMDAPMGTSHITQTSLTDEQKFAIQKKNQSIGTAYIESLLTFIRANATDYPEFKQTITSTNPYHQRDNDGKKTVWL